MRLWFETQVCRLLLAILEAVDEIMSKPAEIGPSTSRCPVCAEKLVGTHRHGDLLVQEATWPKPGVFVSTGTNR